MNHQILINNPELITIDLIKDMIEKKEIKLESKDPFFLLIKEFLGENKLINLEECYEYLTEKIRIAIQDKYLDQIILEIKNMKGSGIWADTITKVMTETAGMFEMEMEDEIDEIYS